MTRVIFSIQHPAHVHLFRNAIEELKNRGNEVRVFARKKEIVEDLLHCYDIEHEVLAPEANSLLELAKIELIYEYKLAKRARSFGPDVMVAMGGVGISRPALLSGAQCLVLTDTEHATLQNKLAFPFADRILTPDCYQDNIGDKQVRYPGYHELAYLHPNRFDPDPSVVKQADVDPHKKYVILRLVSWDAVHDVGDSGFEDIVDAVTAIESTGARVLITSESDLPQEIEDRRLVIEPHKIHHLMAFSDLFIGESATMATESAVLGSPSIFVSSSTRGYTDELSEEYGLVWTYSDQNREKQAINQAIDILENNDDINWCRRHDDLLQNKIDTTEFILSQIKEL